MKKVATGIWCGEYNSTSYPFPKEAFNCDSDLLVHYITDGSNKYRISGTVRNWKKYLKPRSIERWEKLVLSRKVNPASDIARNNLAKCGIVLEKI